MMKEKPSDEKQESHDEPHKPRFLEWPDGEPEQEDEVTEGNQWAPG